MRIQDLSGKKICIVGFGREGKATAEALETYARGCDITIADQNSELKTTNYKLQTGPNYLKHLDRFDVLIKSPGVFPNPELEAVKKKTTSSTQIFLDSIKDSGATVIGVTGSKGKSTTSSLIHHILKSNNQKPITKNLLVGNIGEPAIAHLKDASSNTIFVQEMSSYQLMDLTSSPHIAVITSFFPEHLDYHGSLENYLAAKKHIAQFQTKDDLVFFNGKNYGARAIAQESVGKKIPVDISDSPVKLEETKLKGAHNLENIALAAKVAEHLGIPKGAIIEAVKSFTPLAHRLQSVRVKDGLEWINDSISTTPESAIAAIDALGDRVSTIILGGQDRGYDFSTLAKRIANSTIETVILLPDSGKLIGEEIKKTRWKGKIVSASTMSEAVTAAKTSNQKPATSNPIVLLSPASPSYGHFKNFEDRGGQFAAASA